jgi:hypothetical protein
MTTTAPPSTQPAATPLYGPVDILQPAWGIDTMVAGVLTEAQLTAMLHTPLGTTGRSPLALCGYVPLPGNAVGWDMTAAQLRRAMDLGWLVWLVQHCPAGTWTASAERGDAAGRHAAQYTAGIGYDAGCHLGMDVESLANSGAPVAADAVAWCAQVATPILYEGFDPGLSPEQLYELPDVNAYWGAYGPWNVAKRGVRARQGRTLMHCGVEVDPDYLAPDALGGVLRAMGRLDLHGVAPIIG